jgi:Protein of unknown function (DUF1236)
MKRLSLVSTTAVVLMSAGVASAQHVKDEGNASSPAAHQNAPAEKSTPETGAGDRNGRETSGQSSHESSPGEPSGRSSQNLKPGSEKSSQRKTPETTGQAPKAADQEKQGGMNSSSDANKERRNGSSATLKNQSETNRGAATDTNAQNSAQGSSSARSNETAADRSATERTTTGQGAAAGSVKLSTEQRTKITSIIKQQKVEPTHLNVSIRVGTRIPDSVRFHPLPVEVVNVYPEWRGYDYILVDEQIVVLDPRTHEIVAVLEA